ncbi:ATP-binding protein [Kitasatospora sp. NPDC004669]|uniref:ATP-binding protein n=1 Tax=Kitasatospora sp. NPDC004669 TaxID=3154555 RepID=UPI0033B847C2
MSGSPDSRVADEGRLDVEQISGTAEAEPRRGNQGGARTDAGHPDRPDRPEKPENPENPEKPENPEQPEQPDQRGRPGRPTRPDRGPGRKPGRKASGDPAEGVWRFRAAAEEASVPRTRHAVRDRLLAQGMAGVRYQELVDDLLLIVSELVSNAVTHAAELSPEVITELSVRRGWVRVSVEDGDPYHPKALESDTGRTGGRGLLLVKSVTLQAGGVCDVERTGEGGKVIWASLPVPSEPER